MVSADDPFVRLGLPRDATLDQARAARRRLAKSAHPDAGGSAPSMQEINAAFDAVVAHLTGRRPLPSVITPPPVDHPGQEPSARRGRTGWSGVQRDEPSFTLNVLPVDAFDLVSRAAVQLGQVISDDPPYVLDVQLAVDACWCRLELLPEAGGTTVLLTIAGAIGAETPDVETVRDRWVDQLNRLGSYG